MSQARAASNSLSGIAAPSPQVQRDRAVEQAGVHVRQAEMRGERAGDRALAACRGPVDGESPACVADAFGVGWMRVALTGAHGCGKAPAERRRHRWRPAPISSDWRADHRW